MCMCVWGCGYWCSSGTSRKHVSMGGTLLDYTEGSKGSAMAVDGLQWFHRGGGVRLGVL